MTIIVDLSGGGTGGSAYWDKDRTGDDFLTQHVPGDDIKLKDSGGNQTFFHDTSDSGSTQIGKSGVAGVNEVKDASDVVQEKLNSAGDNYHKGLFEPVAKETLADDAETTVSNGKAGFGLCNIGDNVAYAFFTFSTTAVTLVANSVGNVANTDTDTNLCIYYDGANLNIKNRLGSSLDARYTIWNS
jgi:hypothetical protein